MAKGALITVMLVVAVTSRLASLAVKVMVRVFATALMASVLR